MCSSDQVTFSNSTPVAVELIFWSLTSWFCSLLVGSDLGRGERGSFALSSKHSNRYIINSCTTERIFWPRMHLNTKLTRWERSPEPSCWGAGQGGRRPSLPSTVLPGSPDGICAKLLEHDYELETLSYVLKYCFLILHVLYVHGKNNWRRLC